MTYGHHVKANFAPNREICRFPPFLIVVLQRRHQIRNLREILIYLKKRTPKTDRYYRFYSAITRCRGRHSPYVWFKFAVSRHPPGQEWGHHFFPIQ